MRRIESRSITTKDVVKETAAHGTCYVEPDLIANRIDGVTTGTGPEVENPLLHFSFEWNDRVVRPKIFMMWASGWENAPLLCKLCALSWQKHNRDFDVVKLDNASIKEWLPDLFRTEKDACLTELDAAGNPRILVAKQTDYIRLRLLERYGGIWADATTMATGSISRFIEKNAGSEEFFVFDRRHSYSWGQDEHADDWPMWDPFAKQNLQLSNWFLIYYPYAKQNGLDMNTVDPERRMRYMADRLLQVLRDEVEGNADQVYFAMHYMVQMAPFWNNVWSNMPSSSAEYPHTAEFRLGFFHSIRGGCNQKAEDILLNALKHFPAQKLSHKLVSDDELWQLVDHDLLGETVIGVLMKSALGGLEEAIRFIKRSCPQRKFPSVAQPEWQKLTVLNQLATKAEHKQRKTYKEWTYLLYPVRAKSAATKSRVELLEKNVLDQTPEYRPRFGDVGKVLLGNEGYFRGEGHSHCKPRGNPIFETETSSQCCQEKPAIPVQPDLSVEKPSPAPAVEPCKAPLQVFIGDCDFGIKEEYADEAWDALDTVTSTCQQESITVVTGVSSSESPLGIEAQKSAEFCEQGPPQRRCADIVDDGKPSCWEEAFPAEKLPPKHMRGLDKADVGCPDVRREAIEFHRKKQQAAQEAALQHKPKEVRKKRGKAPKGGA